MNQINSKIYFIVRFIWESMTSVRRSTKITKANWLLLPFIWLLMKKFFSFPSDEWQREKILYYYLHRQWTVNGEQRDSRVHIGMTNENWNGKLLNKFAQLQFQIHKSIHQTNKYMKIKRQMPWCQYVAQTFIFVFKKFFNFPMHYTLTYNFYIFCSFRSMLTKIPFVRATIRYPELYQFSIFPFMCFAFIVPHLSVLLIHSLGSGAISINLR